MMPDDPKKKTENPPQELIDAADNDEEFEVGEEGPIPPENLDDADFDPDEDDDEKPEDEAPDDEDDLTEDEVRRALKNNLPYRGGQQPDGGTLDLGEDGDP